MGLVYNATEGKEQYLIFLDGEGGGGGIDESKIIIKSETIPEASTATYKKIYIYAGETNDTYTHGYIYECVADETAQSITTDFFPEKIGFDFRYATHPTKTFTSDVEAMSAFIIDVLKIDNPYSVVSGRLVVDEVTIINPNEHQEMWYVYCTDKNGQEILTHYKIYASDLQAYGIQFAYPPADYSENEPINFTFNWQTSLSNLRWVRLDVQPNNGSATFNQFNPEWHTTTTFTQFLNDINSDNTAVEGMAYLGDLACSGLPTGINNAEVVVEIINSTTNSKCIHVIMTSGDVYPYRWEYTYWNNGSNVSGWIGFQPELTAGENINIQDNTISAVDTKPNLFDIKLLNQAVVDNEGKTDKGWACLSHTTRKDIVKESVPTLYNDIKDKYDNCDSGTTPITDLTNMSVPLLYEDGYYYFLDKNDYKTLKKSNNLDLSSPITVCDLSSYINSSYPKYMYLIKGNNTYAIYINNGNKHLYIFNNDWSFKYDIVAPYSAWVFEDVVKYIDGYYYILSDRKILMRASESTGESETLATDIPAPAYNNTGSFCGDMIKVGNYIFYNYWVRSNSSCICRVDITDGSYISKAFTLYRGNYSTLMYENNTLFFFCNYTTTHYKYVSTDLGENWTENTINGISNEGQAQSIQKIGNTYYLALDTGIYTSTDLTNFTLFMNKGVALSHWKAFFCNENNNIIVITSIENFYCNYSYTGVVKTVYTDTYQINGSSVAINYYKFNDWKICLPNTTNDTNLDTVYNFLGYLNYWRLDLTSGSETISLPRNSNLWTMMYVGDDYQDSNLPSGYFAGIATKEEVKNLIPTQTDNNGKFLTTNGTTISWAEVQSGGFSTINFFNNNIGLTIDTQLSLGNSVLVFKNGIGPLEPISDYSISGSTITFLTPLANTDRIAVINGNIDSIQVPKIITFTNKEISVWLSDSTYAGYGYKAEVSCNGVTSSMVANVIFAPTEADSGNYATVCNTGTNTVTIYSKVNTTITIPTIVAMEG